MTMQNMLLTATAPDVVDADTTDTTGDVTATEDTNTADEATVDVETSDGTVAGDADVTNISVNENGELVIVNPETGEEVPLSEDQISSLTNMTSTPANVQQPITPAITGVYIAYAIFCIGLVAIILSQKKRSASFGNGMSNGSSGSETYWNKNKGRSMEGQLDKFTRIGLAIFIVATLAISLL